MLSVVDEYKRECLALEVDKSFASGRVTRVLDRSRRSADCGKRFAATTGRS